jgi:hypothetical protein
MAKTSMDAGLDTGKEVSASVIKAGSDEKINLPSPEFITDADMTRDGNDLLLETASGEKVVIEGYFSADPSPILTASNGSVLTPSLVEAFAHSPMEYAARGTATDKSPVGAVEEVKGSATVTRADGTVETVTIGTPIYEGDIITTDAKGAVNISFLDETSMAVSENARMAIDKYSFDPSTENGTTHFSVLRGLFVFTSGLIGRDDPDDVKIDTPVGSIGIRGTIIAGEIMPGGESKISVLEGAIVVTNATGSVTLSDQFETVSVSGYESGMHNVGTLPAADIGARFNSIGSVLPSLFTTVNDVSAEQPSQEQQPSHSNTPAREEAPQESAPQSMNETPQENLQTTSVAVQPALSEPLSLDSGQGTNGLPTANTALGTSVTSPSSMTAEPVNVLQPMQPPPPPAAGATLSPPPIVTVQPPPSVINTEKPGTGGTTVPPANVLDLNTASGVSKIADNISNKAGYMISAAGDLNHDGFDDFVFNNNSGTHAQNLLYTIHGGSADLPSVSSLPSLGASMTTMLIDTSRQIVQTASAGQTMFSIVAEAEILSVNVNGTPVSASSFTYNPVTGTITFTSGLSAGDNVTMQFANTSGNSIAAAGDFNGDGTMDYVIGQMNGYAGTSHIDSGNAYIISGSDPNVTRTSFNSSVTTGAEIGTSVDGIGDFNNDGYADVVIGAPKDSSGAGSTYLVFGNTGMDPLSGTSAMPIHPTSSNFGESVSGIGDFNGDGFSDFAVGAPQALGGNGQAMLFYGSNSGVPSTPSATITGATGSKLGDEVLSLGDLNGDGKSDLLIAGNGNIGSIYLGGNASTAAATFSLSASYDVQGGNGIGDFNGDGFDDFALSVKNIVAGENTAYVVFGRDGFGGTIDLNYLNDSSNALQFKWSGSGDVEIENLGDLDGDGYADFAMGVQDLNGAATGNGGIYVIYGRNYNSGDGVVSGTGNDTFDGRTGATAGAMSGGAGRDIFMLDSVNYFNNAGARIDGGGNTSGGRDMIMAMGNLDFTNVNFEKIDGVEGIAFGQNGKTVTLTMENLFNLLKSSDENILVINQNSGVTGSSLILTDGDGTDSYTTGPQANDVQTLLEDATAGGTISHTTTNSGGVNYDVFQIGGYKLMIDQSIAVDAQ